MEDGAGEGVSAAAPPPAKRPRPQPPGGVGGGDGGVDAVGSSGDGGSGADSRGGSGGAAAGAAAAPASRLSAPAFAGLSTSFIKSIVLYYNPESRNGPVYDDATYQYIADHVEFLLRAVLLEAVKMQGASLASLARATAVSRHRSCFAPDGRFLTPITLDDTVRALETLHLRFRPLASPVYAGVARRLSALTAAAVDADACNDDEVDLAHFARAPPPAAPLPRLDTAWLAVGGRTVAHGLNTFTLDLEEFRTNDRTTSLRDLFERISSYGLPAGAAQVGVSRKRAQEVAKLAPALVSFEAKDVIALAARAEAVTHQLTSEHMLLLEHLKTAFLDPLVRGASSEAGGESSERVERALKAVEFSPGVKQVAPYLVLFLSYQVYGSLTASARGLAALAAARLAVSGMQRLLRNGVVDLSYCMHQLLEALLFAATFPSGGGDRGDCAAAAAVLRRAAAGVVAELLRRYGSLSLALHSVVARAYERALGDPETATAGTLLGAVAGLRALGPQACVEVLLPRVPRLAALVGDTLRARAQRGDVARAPVVLLAEELLAASTDSFLQYGDAAREALEGLSDLIGTDDAATLALSAEPAVGGEPAPEGENGKLLDTLTAWVDAQI